MEQAQGLAAPSISGLAWDSSAGILVKVDLARQQWASRAAGLKVLKEPASSEDATHQGSNEPPEQVQPGIVRG